MGWGVVVEAVSHERTFITLHMMTGGDKTEINKAPPIRAVLELRGAVGKPINDGSQNIL